MQLISNIIKAILHKTSQIFVPFNALVIILDIFIFKKIPFFFIHYKLIMINKFIFYVHNY
jgi:hypothetical protein